MKILGIVGSPRKGGNTEILVEEALAAAGGAGAKTEIFLVAGKKISGCQACNTCRDTGVCKINDDMQPLYKQMEEADGIIFATPVYFGGVTAQLKAIMDRTFAFLPKRPLKGKVAAPMVVLRRVGGGQTRTALYGFFMSQGMIPVRGSLGYGRDPGDVWTGVGGNINSTAIEEARDTGKEMVQMLKRLNVK
jgi:multimeric flavodoxin WrbA